MAGFVSRYIRWLHTRWPAGQVEKLPEVNQDGSTKVPGVFVAGDIAGIPLLKFASHTGARAVQTIVSEESFDQRDRSDESVFDLVIIGAGVAGMAAALEAQKHDLKFELVEAAEPFSTIVNFPKGKPIFTYPSDMNPSGELKFSHRSAAKEGLLEELKATVDRAGLEPKQSHAVRVRRKGKILHVECRESDALKTHRVIIAIGRSGSFRKLQVPGEDREKVYNRLHDPRDFPGRNVLVVGGGDSALETAIALASCGAHVTLSYRNKEFNRPKPENIANVKVLADDPEADVVVENPSSERVTTATGSFMKSNRTRGSLRLMMGSHLKEIGEFDATLIDSQGKEERIANEVVFPMIGRQPPLDFFRRSGIPISGEWRAKTWIGLGFFFLFCTWLYHWKSYGFTGQWINPGAAMDKLALAGGAWRDPSTLLGTIRISASSASFYYTFAYCACVVAFGIRRIKRRKTPYIKTQTIVLMLVQCFPLFLLPEVFFPWAGHNGWFGERQEIRVLTESQVSSWHSAVKMDASGNLDPAVTLSAAKLTGLVPSVMNSAEDVSGWKGWPGLVLKSGHVQLAVDFDHRTLYVQDLAANGCLIGDSLFPGCTYGHGREYWRAYGFILAWPLSVYNWFTQQPLWGWLILGFLQTFVLIPILIYFYGKGAFCGWICSCGALAETMGDAHRHKMPHGPLWNRLNMTGQVVLLFALVLLALRVISWIMPNTIVGVAFNLGFEKLPVLNYKYVVDLLLAGIFGVAFYFHFSGRVWCRFACPLAALMHIYARFSRFRIFAEKKKCISCNVCTSVCHQGIDIMNFANKGLPMEDPQCVRCSACVQSCPTGVLSFGQIDKKTEQPKKLDRLPASAVQVAEARVSAKQRQETIWG